MIDRQDMLELTRRMTVARNCFDRISGCYFDRDGEVDDTFNSRFLNLSTADKTANLKIAKAIPFSRTNDQLVEYRYDAEDRRAGSMWQLLLGILKSELRDDALLDILYEQIGRQLRMPEPMGVYLFHGVYDIPVKGTDHQYIGESEEIYPFLIGAVGPVTDDYTMKKPDYGFLYPAFSFRSADINAIDIFESDPNETHEKLTELLLR
jgi:hypothetical protein